MISEDIIMNIETMSMIIFVNILKKINNSKIIEVINN